MAWHGQHWKRLPRPWQPALSLLYWALLLSLGIGLLMQQLQSAESQSRILAQLQNLPVELPTSKSSATKTSVPMMPNSATWIADYLSLMDESVSTRPGESSGPKTQRAVSLSASDDCRRSRTL